MPQPIYSYFIFIIMPLHSGFYLPIILPSSPLDIQAKTASGKQEATASTSEIYLGCVFCLGTCFSREETPPAELLSIQL